MAEPISVGTAARIGAAAFELFGGGSRLFPKEIVDLLGGRKKPAGPATPPIAPGPAPQIPSPGREPVTGFGVEIPAIFRRGIFDIIQATRQRSIPGGGPGGRVGRQRPRQTPEQKEAARRADEFRKAQKARAEAARRAASTRGARKEREKKARARREEELARLDTPGVAKGTQAIQVAGPRRTAGQIRRESRARRRIQEQQPARDLPPLPGRGPQTPGEAPRGPGLDQGPPEPTLDPVRAERAKLQERAAQGELSEITVQAQRRPVQAQPELAEVQVKAQRRPQPTPSPRPAVPRSVQLGILQAVVAGVAAGTATRTGTQAVTIQGQQFAPTPAPAPRPAPAPGLQTQAAPAGTRTRQGRCEKRARRNRQTCWRGFYEEFPTSTKFTKWEKVNCRTRKRI